MFSGIVETTGEVSLLEEAASCRHMTIIPKLSSFLDDVKIGDSISVSGVCLTVTALTKQGFDVSAVPHTLRMTTLGGLVKGSPVNLEKSLAFNGRIGGHCVQGHVDGVGKILSLEKDGEDALFVKIGFPTNLGSYIVSQGYIALDGMSITVVEAAQEWFSVTFIPHTKNVTIVAQYQVGSLINIETDILGKYIEKLYRTR